MSATTAAPSFYHTSPTVSQEFKVKKKSCIYNYYAKNAFLGRKRRLVIQKKWINGKRLFVIFELLN